MSLIVLIIAAALFVAFILTSGNTFFSRHRALNLSLTALMFVLLIGSESLVILNEYVHFGMKSTTQTKKINLYSVVRPASGGRMQAAVPFIMLRKDVGRDKIYLYNVSQSGKVNVKHNGIADRSRFEVTDKSPYLQIKTTRHVFKNKFYRSLFLFSGQEHVKTSTLYVFHLPQQAQVLTQAQLRQMEKKPLQEKK